MKDFSLTQNIYDNKRSLKRSCFTEICRILWNTKFDIQRICKSLTYFRVTDCH